MELGARALWPAQAPAGGGLAVYFIQVCTWRARGSQLLFLLAFCSSGPSRESAALTTTVYFVHKTIIMKGTKSLHKPPFARGVELPMRLESGGVDNFEMLQCTDFHCIQGLHLKYTYHAEQVPVLACVPRFPIEPRHEVTNAMHAIAQPALHLKVCLASHEDQFDKTALYQPRPVPRKLFPVWIL